MNGLTQSVTVDRRARLLAFGALIAAALMLSLSAFSTSGRVGPDDRARARRLRSACRMGRSGRRAAQGRLPDGDPGARPDFCVGRRGDRAVDAGFDPGRQDPGGTLLRRVRDHQRRQRAQRCPRTGLHVPESGETINSLGVGYAPGAFLAYLVFAQSLPYVIVDPQFFPEDFAQDLNPKLGAEIAAEQRPTSLGLFVTPSGPAAWHALPSWYA